MNMMFEGLNFDLPQERENRDNKQETLLTQEAVVYLKRVIPQELLKLEDRRKVLHERLNEYNSKTNISNDEIELDDIDHKIHTTKRKLIPMLDSWNGEMVGISDEILEGLQDILLTRYKYVGSELEKNEVEQHDHREANSQNTEEKITSLKSEIEFIKQKLAPILLPHNRVLH